MNFLKILKKLIYYTHFGKSVGSQKYVYFQFGIHLNKNNEFPYHNSRYKQSSKILIEFNESLTLTLFRTNKDRPINTFQSLRFQIYKFFILKVANFIIEIAFLIFIRKFLFIFIIDNSKGIKQKLLIVVMKKYKLYTIE